MTLLNLEAASKKPGRLGSVSGDRKLESGAATGRVDGCLRMSTSSVNDKRGSVGGVASPSSERRGLVTSGGLGVASPPAGLEKKSVVREFSVSWTWRVQRFCFFFFVWPFPALRG